MIPQITGMLMPALDMTSALDQVATPVQMVRLWAESMLEAINLVNKNLFGEDGESVLGGDDIPSVVLVLTCLVGHLGNCPEMTYHVKLAKLFCLDNYGVDGQKYRLLSYARYENLAEQYAFQVRQARTTHSPSEELTRCDTRGGVAVH